MGTSRPGPNLYTDSVVKLSPQGKLLWYYQLTPHDLYDWDLQNSPLLTTANGQPVVIDGGKAGIESQLATNGSTVFAAVNNLGLPVTVKGAAESSSTFSASIAKATGEMVAVSQDTGKIIWDDKLPSTPYGAATLTNDVVFTTTYSGYQYAFNAATGAILLKTPLSSGSDAPVAIDGDYILVGAGVQVPKNDRQLIIAYKLGATGKLPRHRRPVAAVHGSLRTS